MKLLITIVVSLSSFAAFGAPKCDLEASSTEYSVSIDNDGQKTQIGSKHFLAEAIKLRVKSIKAGVCSLGKTFGVDGNAAVVNDRTYDFSVRKGDSSNSPGLNGLVLIHVNLALDYADPSRRRTIDNRMASLLQQDAKQKCAAFGNGLVQTSPTSQLKTFVSEGHLVTLISNSAPAVEFDCSIEIDANLQSK